MKKILVSLLLCITILAPSIVFAQDVQSLEDEEIFKAKVIEILEQKEITREDGSVSVRQKLKLEGLEEKWRDRDILFDGMGIDVLSAGIYKTGDEVLVNYVLGANGEERFYIVGFSRANTLYLLVLLFVFAVIFIGRLKGIRALFVLLLTFLIILKFIIPQIVAGSDPLFIGILGSFFILVLSIYITEGYKRTSTIAVFSALLSLIITGLLSVWFSEITKLTGLASEEAIFLIDLGNRSINIKGLLLAGIIIGALGVLDDVVISQVALVKELREANPGLSKAQIYHKAMRVGISHLSSIVNTLFLAYAGASLPILILFNIKQQPFVSFQQVIDNEIIATEIVRTFTGSIGLVLAVPIASFLAVNFVGKSKK